MAVITPDDDLLAFVIASKKENNIIKQDFIFGFQKFVSFARRFVVYYIYN